MPAPTNLHKTSTIARMTQHLENHNRADNSTSNNLTNNMTTNTATLPQNLINLAYLQQNFNHQNLTPLNMTRIPQIMKPEQYASLQQHILVQQALTQTHNSSLQQKHVNVTHDLRLQQRKRTRIPPSKQELQISEALLHHNRLGEKSQCSICGKFVMQLPAHMQCHSNERKYCCPKCPSKFKRMQTLKQHLPIHLDKPQFRCDICGNTFKQAPNFYLHYKNTHGLKGNIQKCKINKDELENLVALVDYQHNIGNAANAFLGQTTQGSLTMDDEEEENTSTTLTSNIPK